MNFDTIKPPDLEGIEPDKIITILFGYRQRLLNAARDDELIRWTIFHYRAEIGAIFRKFGGERHEQSAQIFGQLENPEQILAFVSPKKVKIEDSRRIERMHHRPGFYIFGKQINHEQAKSIRWLSTTGLKVGDPIYVSLLGLFHVEQDKRPIYINDEPTEALKKKVFVLVQLRPDLVERLHFLHFDSNNNAVIERFLNNSLSIAHNNSLSTDEKRAIDILGDFIYHRPAVGEIFFGRIVSVYKYGVFVEFLPGIEGFVSRSELPGAADCDCQNLFSNGEWINVEVIGFLTHGRISLSANSAIQSIREGKEILFERVQTEMLELTRVTDENKD